MTHFGNIITQCDNVKLVLDFLGIDDRTPAVRIGFELHFVSNLQEFIYRRSESWFKYEQIDALAFTLSQEGNVCLVDLSHYPVLKFERSENGCWLVFNPKHERESLEAEELSIHLKLDPEFPQKLSLAIIDFPRWW